MNSLAAAFIALSLASVASDARTQGWLGDGTGNFPAGRLGGDWSQSSEGKRWCVKLPDWGNSSPVVLGERVFLAVEPSTVMALATGDGHTLWRREVDYADTLAPSERAAFAERRAEVQTRRAALKEAEQTYNRLKRELRRAKSATAGRRASLDEAEARVTQLLESLKGDADVLPPEPIPDLGTASSTPVTDGSLVYSVFGNGVVSAHALDGTPRWARFLGRPEQQMRGYHRGQAASPLLLDGVLIVAMNQLVGLDPATGETRWTGKRYGDFGTPSAIILGDRRSYVVTPEGDVVRASDGHESASSVGSVFFVSPLVIGDRVMFVGSPINPNALDRLVTAVRLVAVGDRVVATRLWETRLSSERTYTSAVARDGIIYALGVRGTLTAVDAKDGGVLWESRLGLGADAVYASPVLAGDALLAVGRSGQAVVTRLGRTFEPIRHHTLEPTRATPSFVGGDLIYRGLHSVCRYATGP